MKKLIAIISFIVMTTAVMAQTAEEIISRMEAEMNKHDESEGVAMTIDIKVFLLGTMTTRAYTLGDKSRVEASVLGNDMITWDDGVTTWTYDSKKGEVEINKATPKEKSDSEGDIKMFEGVTDGYDVKIDKETSTEWHIRCKKSRNNPDEDAPKKIDLVIAKDTYWPVSLSTSLKGIDMTMRDISFGVTEKQVTFNPADYPNIKMVDKR